MDCGHAAPYWPCRVDGSPGVTLCSKTCCKIVWGSALGGHGCLAAYSFLGVGCPQFSELRSPHRGNRDFDLAISLLGLDPVVGPREGTALSVFRTGGVVMEFDAFVRGRSKGNPKIPL